MSKRAEDLADKIYPFRYDSHGDVIDFKNTIILRGVCIETYEQAEKDLALTWEDIKAIDELLTLVYEPDNEEEYYTRVLEEFNRKREEK